MARHPDCLFRLMTAHGTFAFIAMLGAGIVSAAPASVTSPSHLIVCPAQLAPAFTPLAVHRTQTGTPSAVVLLEDILTSSPAGADDAATLRNYLAEVHGEGSLRYVLLAGDATLVPARRVRSTFYPAGGFTDVPTDLYFAALDGDWDGDGDGILCESFVSSANPGDNADLDPDIAVGRAPVATVAQAERFVQGIVTYEHPGQGAHVGSALLLAEVLLPYDWSGGSIQLDGATFAQRLGAQLLGLATPVVSTRMYENHTQYAGALPLTPAGAVAAVGSGLHGTLYYAGNGTMQEFSAGSGPVTIGQIDALANAPNYLFALCVLSSGADFTADAILNHLVTAPNGGGVAAVGYTVPVFPNTASDYVTDFFTAAAAPQGNRLGDALRAALHAHASSTFYNTSSRWTNLSMVLLGDPATPYRTEPGPVAASSATFGGLKQRFH